MLYCQHQPTMSTNNPTPEASISKIDKDIKLILDLLDNRIDDLKGEVALSSTLLDEGIRTKLSSHIQHTIENPLSSLVEAKTHLQNTIQSISNEIIQKLLSTKVDLIEKAFRSNADRDGLQYAIVLKEDSEENRQEIFNLLNYYENTELGSHVEADIQFIPLELERDLYKTQPIDLTPNASTPKSSPA